MAGRGRAWVTAVVLVTVVVVAGCGTDAGGRVAGASASSSGLPASASVSVPASVPKDSVLDLNSTKDMTGVVTTVPIGRTPYDKYLPDICQFIPDSVVRDLGFATKKKGFPGTALVTQGCDMETDISPTKPQPGAVVGFFVNNIDEILNQDGNRFLQRDVFLSPKVSATVLQKEGLDFGVVPGAETCKAAWGTFFGAIVVLYSVTRGYRANVCDSAVRTARAMVSYMPKSPSQMRASA